MGFKLDDPWKTLGLSCVLCVIVLSRANADGQTQTTAAQTTAATCTETAGPTRALGLFKPGDAVGLEEGFRDPPPISRVQCWWQCHGSAFTKKEITRQLEEFKAKGMGGVTIKDTGASYKETVSMPRDEKTAHIKDVPYMSPQWLDMFAHIVAECGRLGMICRSRLGSGWNEGGPWVTPEMSSQMLAFVKSKPITGPGKYAGPIPTAEDGSPTAKALESGEAFVVAVPDAGGERVDLTDKVSEDRKLAWDVPNGTWTLVCCFSKPSGVLNMSTSPAGAGLHHDHLSTAAADLHLKNVAGRMLARLGTFENTAFDGLNHDSWELGNPTWTPGFRQAFIERRGYDPVPYLHVMMSVEAQGHRGFSDSKVSGKLSEEELRFLFDLRTTASDLIVENFYRHVTRWCRAHGVAFEAEAGGPAVVPKDLIEAQGAVDIPMGEFWLQRFMGVKVASSAAHAYGKRLVSLESLTDTTFTAEHNHISTRPALMKGRLDEAFLLGGNYLTLAVVEYSPAEAGLPGWLHNCGPHLNHCQTWWPMARPFFDYLARCCFLLQSGRNVAQVAVYHTFRTGKDPRWNEPRDDDLEKWPRQLAADYVGDDLVQNHMRVRDGRIVLTSGATYQVLCIVPTRLPTMPLATLAAIRDLARQGATVVWLAEPLARCPGLTGYPQCDAQFKAILKDLRDSGQFVTLPEESYAGLVPIVEKSPEPPAWRIDGDAPLRSVHRQTEEADIFFVVNRAEKRVVAPVTFRINNRTPEFWNPETGAIEPAVFQKVDDGTRMTVRLPARGSIFVVFREQGGPPPEECKTPGKALAPVPIDSAWEVEFPEGSGAPLKTTFRTLKSWTESDDPGVPHFSGIATYRTTFDCPASVAQSGLAVKLDLGRVAEVCEVRLGGKLIGVGWHPPYHFDVTDALRTGQNRIEVRVANLWHNRLVGDAVLPKTERVSRMAPETHYERLRGKKLMDSGLLGPVRIVFEATHRN